MKKVLIYWLMCCVTWTAQAAGSGPFSVDADTLHLYHFDGDTLDLAGTIHLTRGAGATVLKSSAPGFKTALDTYDGITGGGPYAAGASNPSAVSNFTGNNGAFTFEAIVRPDVTLPRPANAHMQIISMDSNNGTATRGWHFRINQTGTLQFTKITDSTQDFQVALPTDGDHGYAVGAWYHAAVTYNGAENTAGNLKLYWTKLDSGATEVQLLSSFQMTADLNPAAASGFGIGNEMRATGGYTENFEGLIDEVRISRIAREAGDMIVKSLGAANPSPAHGASNVNPATTQLRWNVSEAANATTQYLYMVERGDPNFLGISPVAVTDLVDPIEAYVPLTLVTDKVYYWRVDTGINDSSADDPNTIRGTVWTFETAKSVPVITDDPDATAVREAQTAVFNVIFTSLTVPTVRWYKAGTPEVLTASQTGVGTTSSGVISVDVQAIDSGVYSSTLSIGDVEIADEGYYYCSVTNSSLATDDSLSAGLRVNRLLARYLLNGDTTDAIGGVDGILKSADLNDTFADAYAAGAPTFGQAVNLDGQRYIEVAGGYPNASLNKGLESGTFSLWVNLPVGSNKPVADIIGSVNASDGTYLRCYFMPEDSSLNITGKAKLQLRIANATGSAREAIFDVPDGINLRDQQWHLLTWAWDCSQAMIEIYADGQKAGSLTADAISGFGDWDNPIAIGGTHAGSAVSNRLTGMIDDANIYNYVQSYLEIADAYVAGYPDAYFCFDLGSGFDGTYDFDNNCRIDLADFAHFARQWLSCGRYLTEDCN